MLAQVVDRRQALAHARVVGDADVAVLLLDRDVEIDAHEDAFAGDLEIADGEFGIKKRWAVWEFAGRIANARAVGKDKLFTGKGAAGAPIHRHAARPDQSLAPAGRRYPNANFER